MTEREDSHPYGSKLPETLTARSSFISCQTTPVGADIEKKSMEIVSSLLPIGQFEDRELPVVMRIVHATGDPTIASSVRFHPRAIETALTILRQETWLVADVEMTLAGISKEALATSGCKAICTVSRRKVAQEATCKGKTRAAVAIRRLARQLHGGVAVIGNAPTALREVLSMAKEGVALPALVIGMPVGFVDAAEAKRALMDSELVWVTVDGTRGGSPVAAATTNALLRLASLVR